MNQKSKLILAKKRKHTNTNSDKCDAFGELLGKMVEKQKTSEWLLELEEKHLKYEEKPAEREVEQGREERTFQIQIM